MNIHLIYTLFYFIQLSLSPTTSQQCRNNEYIGFYFNPPTTTTTTDTYRFSSFGLSKFQYINFSIDVDCDFFLNPNATEPPTMYLSITSQQPNLNVNIMKDWMHTAHKKMNTLEDIITKKENKSQVFQFILETWPQYLLNETNDTINLYKTTIPNWYNIWLLRANTDIITNDCNHTSNSHTIRSEITFEWAKEYTQFFPIFENNVITKHELWTDTKTSLPLEIIWNNDEINNTYYNMFIVNEESDWLKCFHLTNIDSTNKDWQNTIETYYYDNEYDNISHPESVWDYTLISESYSPLIAYNNCNVTHAKYVSAVNDNDVSKECYENTCCEFERSPHFFNMYFWYDDDVWSRSLGLYQLLTQYVIEEALCDVYNEIYSDRVLVPDDFYLSVTFFFNFCLLKNGCPNYEQEKAKKKLTFFPNDIGNNDIRISGYKMYATFRTKPLDLAEKIYDMLVENKHNAWKFESYIIRRAKEDFGRHNFDLFGIAISDLPQVSQYIFALALFATITVIIIAVLVGFALIYIKRNKHKSQIKNIEMQQENVDAMESDDDIETN